MRVFVKEKVLTNLTGLIILDFFLVSLATWRVSSLFAREDGIFDVFLRFRMLLGTRFDKTSDEVGTGWLSNGILCVWCNSIWFGAAGAFILAPATILGWFVYLLALSTMTVLIDNYATK